MFTIQDDSARHRTRQPRWRDPELVRRREVLRKQVNLAVARAFVLKDAKAHLKPLVVWPYLKAAVPGGHCWSTICSLRYAGAPQAALARLRQGGFRTAFENAREKAGLPHLRSYDLRHMFCSFALMNGVEKDLLRQWMGHKTTQMIDEVYLHFLDDYRKQQMQKMRIDLPDDCKTIPAPPIIPPPTSP